MKIYPLMLTPRMQTSKLAMKAFRGHQNPMVVQFKPSRKPCQRPSCASSVTY